jgi:hypothetical protein
MAINTGDIAFEGVNAINPDDLAVLALNAIAAGNSFHITDGRITWTRGVLSAYFRATDK